MANSTNAATISPRLSLQPLIDYYDERGLLVNVTGEGDPQTIAGRVLQAVRG